MKFTYEDFKKKYSNEDVCLEKIWKLRFANMDECPKCLKLPRYYRVKKRKCYECAHCGCQLHPLSGTAFENTRTPLTKWFFAVYLMTACKNGVSAKELQRHLGVTYKCAWRMGHKIRELFIDRLDTRQLSGTVQVDEAYMGGYRKGMCGRKPKPKTPVFGAVEEGGRVYAQVVKSCKRHVLFPIIKKKITNWTRIVSDEAPAYNDLPRYAYKHSTVCHSKYQFLNADGYTTNAIEGFWSLLKRSIRGTHVWVSKQHLQKYLDEFAFRYNYRKADQPIFEIALNQISALTVYREPVQSPQSD